MRRPETFDLNLAQPVPGAAGTFTGLWGKQAHRSETRH